MFGFISLYNFFQVKAIVGMTEDCKRHFRLKVRDVLDRLLRKYGYETIQPLVPKDDHIMQKRLKNLKRLNAKKKASKDENEDYDDDGLEEFALKAKPKRYFVYLIKNFLTFF